MREEKRRKEEEEKEARKRAEEEERRRRKEEEDARIRAEEEEERRRVEDERARIQAAEEEAKARAERERTAEEAEKNLKEPQTREDPDIELITEEALDDNLAVPEMEEEEVRTRSHREGQHVEAEELNDVDADPELNGTLAEAGPQLEERDGEEELENRTPPESDSTSVLSSDGVLTPQPSAAGEELDKRSLDDATVLPNADQSRAKSTAVSKGQLSRSQEKREQRRRRGLEHNQRETERASSSVSGKDETSSLKSKPQATRSKERSESKELDQYTFVAWKMKEDRAAKKETKTSPPPAGPVRPSTLSLQPVSDRNGVAEGTGAVALQRRPGAIKEKPEKWRGRRSDGELSERTKTPLYVCSDPLTVLPLTPALTVEDTKSADSCLTFISLFFYIYIYRAETASSSVDSLSPGSEGAGALQVLSFGFTAVLKANVFFCT